MPDRSGEPRPGRDEPETHIPDDLWAEETRRITAETETHIAQLEAQERAAIQATCPLCDHNGTTPEGFPCDHHDPRPAAARGMAAIRAAMGWNGETPAGTAENTPTGQLATTTAPPNTPTTPDPATPLTPPLNTHLHEPQKNCPT